MKKRRFWLIVAAIVAAEVLAAVVWRCYLYPEREVSDLYLRYAEDPGVEASYVKGFRINDTLAIDATLLHATDSASWERLRDELQIRKPHETITKAMESGKDNIMLYLSRKGSAAQEMDKENLNNNDIVGVSYLTQSIAIYHLGSWEQRIAVNYYNYDLSTSTNKEQKQ